MEEEEKEWEEEEEDVAHTRSFTVQYQYLSFCNLVPVYKNEQIKGAS